MITYYTTKGKGKSPAAKKYKAMLAKIKNIEQDKIDMVLDEYFWKVCYEFYKRQMRVWILLAHKYLRTAKVSAKDRKFMIKDDKTKERDEKLDTLDPPMLHGLVQQRSNTFMNADEKEDEEEKSVQFPIDFTYTESHRLNEDVRRITHSLDNIFKGTVTADAVGKIEDNRDDIPKMQGEFEPRSNPYEAMDLTYDRTNLMLKIIHVTGFATKKDSKKARDTTSPK